MTVIPLFIYLLSGSAAIVIGGASVYVWHESRRRTAPRKR